MAATAVSGALGESRGRNNRVRGVMRVQRPLQQYHGHYERPGSSTTVSGASGARLGQKGAGAKSSLRLKEVLL